MENERFLGCHRCATAITDGAGEKTAEKKIIGTIAVVIVAVVVNVVAVAVIIVVIAVAVVVIIIVIDYT